MIVTTNTQTQQWVCQCCRVCTVQDKKDWTETAGPAEEDGDTFHKETSSSKVSQTLISCVLVIIEYIKSRGVNYFNSREK